MTITRRLLPILLILVVMAGGATAAAGSADQTPAASGRTAGAPLKGVPPGRREAGNTPAVLSPEVKMSLTLTSPAFAHQGAIPAEYTCEGKNISPQLDWTGVPAKAKSLVLIIDDPDAPDPAAPKRTWVHWILYNIPTSADSLPKGVAVKDLPPGTLQGLPDSRQPGYGGPCPPIGRHRYFHKLYALDTALPDLKTPTKDKLLKAMEGHVLASAELVGTYQKPRK